MEMFDVWVITSGAMQLSLPHITQYKAVKITDKSVKVIDHGREVTIRKSYHAEIFSNKEEMKAAYLKMLNKTKEIIEEMLLEINKEIESPTGTKCDHNPYKKIVGDNLELE